METQGKGCSEGDPVVSGDRSMRKNGRTYLWLKVGGFGAPALVAVLQWTGWLPLWSWVKSFLAAIPPTAWWILLGCLSHGLAFLAGWSIDRLLRRRQQITEKQAADLVRGSNYWSRLERRSEVGAIQAGIDSERYGLDPDPVDLEVEAINPPRHTPSVEAVLQQFGDDEPDACWAGLYHRKRLREWLVEQALQATVPTRLRW